MFKRILVQSIEMKRIDQCRCIAFEPPYKAATLSGSQTVDRNTITGDWQYAVVLLPAQKQQLARGIVDGVSQTDFPGHTRTVVFNDQTQRNVMPARVQTFSGRQDRFGGWQTCFRLKRQKIIKSAQRRSSGINTHGIQQIYNCLFTEPVDI